MSETFEDGHGPMVESADAADLKPAGETREGSSPSGPTTPLQRWSEGMPESEMPVIGQRRLFFIDGVGDMEGVVTGFSDEECWIRADGSEESWWIGWDMPGMSHVAFVIDGELHKKFLAEVEQEALKCPEQNS